MREDKKMIDNSIPYKCIIMRWEGEQHHFHLIDEENVYFKYFQRGDEIRWAMIQKSVGEFEEYTLSQTVEYFNENFGRYFEYLSKQCVFLCDEITDEYIGTCMAWEGEKDGEKIFVLHWLAVVDKYAGRGYARLLICKIMNIFSLMDKKKAIYLSTQPCSYKAIKIYNDIGFAICKEDTFLGLTNQYKEAIEILRQVMYKEKWNRLVESAVD